MGEEFVVDTSYSGCAFVGWAADQFENDKGAKNVLCEYVRPLSD